MDPSDTECMLIGSSEEGHANKKPRTKDPAHGTEGESLSTASENSLFQAASGSAPTRTRRARRGQGQGSSSLIAMNSASDESESELLPSAQEIAKRCQNPCPRRGKQTSKTKKKSPVKRRGQSERTAQRKPRYSIPLKERRRRMFDRGIKFPFRQLKYLPFKMYFSYEQFVVGGFLNQIKNLKYERSLKESLNDMGVDDNLENENFHLRQYSYMDEDGPLSPISEPGEDLNEDEAEEAVKVVENSTFIVDCQVPKRKEWRIKTKGGERE